MSKAALKGPVKALRGARVVHRPREWLSAEAIEVFFRHAEVLSEGAIHEVKGGDSSYMGSTSSY